MRLEKMESEVKELNEGRWPKSVKPFRLKFECTELDQPLSGQETTFTFTVKANETRRQANEILHLFVMVTNKAIDVETTIAQIKELETKHSCDNFLKCASKQIKVIVKYKTQLES